MYSDFSGLFWHKLPPILNHNCPFLGEITGTRLPWPPARWRAKISSELNLEVFWLSSKNGILFLPFVVKKTSLVLWFQPHLENVCQIASSFLKNNCKPPPRAIFGMVKQQPNEFNLVLQFFRPRFAWQSNGRFSQVFWGTRNPTMEMKHVNIKTNGNQIPLVPGRASHQTPPNKLTSRGSEKPFSLTNKKISCSGYCVSGIFISCETSSKT